MTNKDYDFYRQGIYNQGAAIVGYYNNASSVTDKQTYLLQLRQLMSGFQSYTNQILPSSDYGYINPRFHDFYDFFSKIINDWQAQIAAVAQESGAVGAVAVAATEGCTTGICGPVPPSTPLQTVQVGAPNAQGVYSTATSGGGGVIANNLPLQSGGLAPSPFQNDLPGTLTPSALTPSGAVAPKVLAAGIPGSFDLKSFFTGPMGFALLAVLALVFFLKGIKKV